MRPGLPVRKNDTPWYRLQGDFNDEIVKSTLPIIVIPAKAGIQQIQSLQDAGSVIPDLIRDQHDGSDTFCEIINITNSAYLVVDRLVSFIYYEVCVTAHVDRETLEK